jgi:hypothetical protein
MVVVGPSTSQQSQQLRCYSRKPRLVGPETAGHSPTTPLAPVIEAYHRGASGLRFKPTGVPPLPLVHERAAKATGAKGTTENGRAADSGD